MNPEKLWHYSDAAGLFGIIRTSSLRFGHVGFLNDVTESSYGLGVIERFVADNVPSFDPSFQAAMLEQIRARGPENTEFFICSFSENGDSLSQWQRYGADGRGYAIGFDAKELSTGFGPRVYLRRMLYSEADQRERLGQSVARNLPRIEVEYPFAKKQERGWVTQLRAAHLAGALHAVAWEFKNHRFADECEWRLIREHSFDTSTPPELLAFAPRSDVIKPFVEIRRPDMADASGLLPLRTVVCGPKLESNLATSSVRRFLATHGYKDVLVNASDLSNVWR